MISIPKINLDCPNITDKGLEHLASLCFLKSIIIYESKVTGRGLGGLAQIECLESISLSNVPLEDLSFSEGMRKFAGSHLRGLGLSHCPISDVSLDTIARLDSLVALSLAGTNVSDQGMRVISGMPKLEKLQLWDTKIGDAGVSELLKVHSLKLLALGRSKVTVRGCARLRDVEQLETLAIAVGDFTAEEAAWLQAQLPGVYILYSHATARDKD
jgi:hypothetical protein